jgi:hypothetical protein
MWRVTHVAVKDAWSGSNESLEHLLLLVSHDTFAARYSRVCDSFGMKQAGSEM